MRAPTLGTGSPVVIEPHNMVVVLSDEHAAQDFGCHGHPLVKTSNIDRLATPGTRFSNSYTNCPICMPTRAAFATGRYPHQTRYWCIAGPYEGKPASWGHRLQAAGRPVVSIGMLHHRNVVDTPRWSISCRRCSTVSAFPWAKQTHTCRETASSR